ncbi:unnamed protein product, partial [Laminaria digitata]
VFGVSLTVRQHTLYLDTALLWLVAAGGFIAVAAILGSGSQTSAGASRVGLLAAAAVVLVHNQIEMTFFQPESMGLMWLIVGCAAAGVTPTGDKAASSTGTRRIQWILGGVTAAVLVGGMGATLAGVVRHEQALRGAEAALRRGDVPLAIERLEIAQHAAGWDTEALRWRVRLHAIEPMGFLWQADREAEARRRVDEALAWFDEA